MVESKIYAGYDSYEWIYAHWMNWKSVWTDVVQKNVKVVASTFKANADNRTITDVYSLGIKEVVS